MTISTTSDFSGSYLPSDVQLLLDIVTPDNVNNVDPNHKEQLIQQGHQHYSDMLTLESAPSATHETLYRQALATGTERMAREIASLAHTLHHIFAHQVNPATPLVLVSLVRAGLPIGVLLQRALSDTQAPYALSSRHYGMSIIRDRGLDPVALAQVLTRHPNSPVIFVDGWTGKGAIYGELVRSLRPYLAQTPPHHHQIFHQDGCVQDSGIRCGSAAGFQDLGVVPLLTLADPAGMAWLSASSDDWLMPASLLGSTVSGLISRTLYTPPTQGRHRCVYYDKLQAVDHSLDFINTIDHARQQLTAPLPLLTPVPIPTYATQQVIKQLARRFGIANLNRIKPTIAEATRAILRRDPECVLLNDPAMQDTKLLRWLCQDRGIPVLDDETAISPYRAVTIIKNRSD